MRREKQEVMRALHPSHIPANFTLWLRRKSAIKETGTPAAMMRMSAPLPPLMKAFAMPKPAPLR